jgi:hypothetical protein
VKWLQFEKYFIFGSLTLLSQFKPPPHSGGKSNDLIIRDVCEKLREKKLCLRITSVAKAKF